MNYIDKHIDNMKSVVKSQTDKSENKKNRWNAIGAAFIGALLPSIATIITTCSITNLTKKQIDIADRPILNIKSINTNVDNEFFLFDFENKYDEYMYLQSTELSTPSDIICYPLNIEFENIGNGTLLNLTVYSLNNNFTLSSIDKKKAAEKFTAQYGSKNIIEKKICINLSPINILKNNTINKRCLYLYNKSHDNNYSLFRGLCLYRDIKNDVKTAIIECTFYLPINDSNNDDAVEKIEYALYQEGTAGYNRIMMSGINSENEINFLIKKYKEN